MKKIKDSTAKNLYSALKANKLALPNEEFEALKFLREELQLETSEQIISYLENNYISDSQKRDSDNYSFKVSLNRGKEFFSNAINPITDAYFHFLKMAIDSFSNAINLNPKSSEAHYNRAIAKFYLAKAGALNYANQQSDLSNKIQYFLDSQTTSFHDDLIKAAELGHIKAKELLNNEA